MINASFPGVAGTRKAGVAVRRPGMQLFWVLFAVEAVLILGGLVMVLQVWPTRVPSNESSDVAIVRDAIMARMAGVERDPSIEVLPGMMVPASSIRGFTISGHTYYYYIEGHDGYDPLSQGILTPDQVKIVLRDTTGSEILVIYRLAGQGN